jgi:pyridinium-3,5-biscarboxylic acid mononucleotide sulfurtransferase
VSIAPAADRPLIRLVAELDRHERIAIAVSGGVDSMTLAHAAREFSRARATMYHAAGPAVPAAARSRVEAHAMRHGWPLVLLDAGELADPRYRANPIDRCYYCKSNLYARIRSATPDPIASGTNCDDLADYRPGLRAAAERDVVHPYVDAGFRKADVYALAHRLGLDDLERLPAQPCLASRVETGIAISAADLAFIDDVEAKLSARLGGGTVVRCRVTHAGVVVEIGDATGRDAARVAREVAESMSHARGRVFAGVRPYRRGAAFLHPPATAAAPRSGTA